ncbi:MAG TPA: putative Ig domain-containing protein, partial [Natronosporangium sp.]|nr:putative Ig domain-containing protein [Natronosporangium sp.]
MSGTYGGWRGRLMTVATVAVTILGFLTLPSASATAGGPASGQLERGQPLLASAPAVPAGLELALERSLAEDGLPQTKLVAADGRDGDRFGTAVAVAGDTAVIGAILAAVEGKPAQGAAYVFVREGDAWVEQVKLTASDGQAFDRFGGAVAFDGQTLVIGAWGAAGTTGAAYVFVREGDAWVEQAKLTAPDGRPDDLFGEYVAVAGDTIVVGAPGVDGAGTNFEQGAAYVFTRTGDRWQQEARLEAPDGQRGDQFGHGVAVAGDTVLVGAPFAQVDGANLRGAVYVFSRSQGWGEPTVLAASDGAPLDRFGFSVAMTDDTAVIGAIGAAGVEPSTGAAYVFVRDGDAWVEEAKLVTSDSVTYDNVGVGVAINPGGDRVVLGADFAAVGENSLQGAGYLFVRDGDAWVEEAKLFGADGAENDGFGRSVAVTDGAALAGSSGSTVDGMEVSGAAYLFPLPTEDDTPTDGKRLTASDGAAGDLFGRAVAVDGNTALVGADWADINGNHNQGAAYVFVRDGDAWVEQAKLTAPDGASSHQFGISVDLDGDTAVVGNAREAVYVFTRTGTDWTWQATLTAPEPTGADLFGAAVAIAGDTIVVGARQADVAGQMNQGAAWVFTRTGEQWSAQASLTAADGAAFDLFGGAVAIHADTVVVGAEFADLHGRPDQGAAYVFTRSGDQWVEQAKLTAADGQAGDRFGGAVAVAGDTAVVGAYAAAGDQGAAYVFDRIDGDWVAQARLATAAPSAWFGAAVATTGPAVLVGALHEAGSQGAAYLFVQDGDDWSAPERLAVGDADAQFGNAVALQGDTVLVGAWTSTVRGQEAQGAAYVYHRELPAPDPGPDPEPEPEPVCDTTVRGVHPGPLVVTDGVTCLAAGAQILGEVNVASGAGLVGTAAVVQGPVSALGATRVELAFSQITGPVLVSGATQHVWLFANQVTGSVTLVSNRTPAADVVVSGNVVIGSLACFGNEPAPTDRGLPNTVTAEKVGQCADGPPPVQITTTELPTLHVFEPYHATLTAAGGTAPYTWSVAGLPAGLRLDPHTGVITNDPEAPAITGPVPESVTVTVTDHHGATDRVTLPLSAVTVTRMAAGLEHTCAVTTDTTVYCWGGNLSGQLGDGTTTSRPLPAPVVDPDDPDRPFTGAVDVSAWLGHTCVTTVERTVWCWGFNGGGRLGIGHDRSEVIPVPGQVVGPTGDGYLQDVVAVGAGEVHTCALVADGRAYCWGDNWRGQLGSPVGATGVPVPVADPDDASQPLTGLTALGVGGFHTCAVTEATTAYCWGWNNAGQLGIGDYVPVQSRRPLPVVNAAGQLVTGLATVDGGSVHTCATTTAGTAYCWGQNARGQLGNGAAPENQPAPVPVADPADPTAPLAGLTRVATGAMHTCALTEAGTVSCWGSNSGGQLGDGGTTDRDLAAPVVDPADPTAPLTGVVGVAHHGWHTCAVTEAGIPYCWGHNYEGQLGDGST